MTHNWAKGQQVLFFCYFLAATLMIGAVACLTDSVAEKLGALALLVAFAGLFIIIINQRQDAEDKRTRHDEIVELLREGNRLLGGQSPQGYVVCLNRTGTPNGRVHTTLCTSYLNRVQPDASTMYWGTPHPTWQAARAELAAMGDPGEPCGNCRPF